MYVRSDLFPLPPHIPKPLPQKDDRAGLLRQLPLYMPFILSAFLITPGSCKILGGKAVPPEACILRAQQDATSGQWLGQTLLSVYSVLPQSKAGEPGNLAGSIPPSTADRTALGKMLDFMLSQLLKS